MLAKCNIKPGHTKQQVFKMINQLGAKGIISNEGCVCQSCENHWQTGYNRRRNYKLDNINKKIFTIYNTSILNNVYSESARSHHLNNKYHEYLETEDCIDKGIYHTTEHGDISYEQYSTLIILEMGLNGQRCRFLVDTGADVDALSEEWVKKFAHSATNLVHSDILIQTADKEKLMKGTQELKDAQLVLFPNATSKRFTTKTDFVVLNLDTTRFDGILGVKTLHELGIHIKIPKLDDFAAAAMRQDSKLFAQNYSNEKNSSENFFSPKSDSEAFMISLVEECFMPYHMYIYTCMDGCIHVPKQ